MSLVCLGLLCMAGIGALAWACVWVGSDHRGRAGDDAIDNLAHEMGWVDVREYARAQHAQREPQVHIWRN